MKKTNLQNILSLTVLSFFFMGMNLQDGKQDPIDKLITSINNNDNAKLKDIVSENCDVITNGIVAKEQGINPLVDNFNIIATFKQPLIKISNKIIDNNQIVAEWSLFDSKNAISTGVIIIKIKEDYIINIKLFYEQQTDKFDIKKSDMELENTKFNKSVQSNKYWFYVRTSNGGFYDKAGFHYSQILNCSQKVTTPGYFSKSHAVGPFNTYSDASNARRDEIDIADRSGLELIPRQAICNTRWD